MTNLLAVETSTREGSVALLRDGHVTEAVLANHRAHASDLLPEIDGLLRAAGLELAEVDAVAVGLGPGSYTGLRVACATALGLARGAGLALVGLPSFDAAAFDALEPGEEGVVVQDARSGAVYHARYAREAEVLRVVDAPAVSPPDEAKRAIDASLRIIGDDAAMAALDIEPGDRRRAFAPRAATLGRLGLAQLERVGPSAPESIEPLYLRPFRTRKRG